MEPRKADKGGIKLLELISGEDGQILFPGAVGYVEGEGFLQMLHGHGKGVQEKPKR